MQKCSIQIDANRLKTIRRLLHDDAYCLSSLLFGVQHIGESEKRKYHTRRQRLDSGVRLTLATAAEERRDRPVGDGCLARLLLTRRRRRTVGQRSNADRLLSSVARRCRRRVLGRVRLSRSVLSRVVAASCV